MSRLSRRFAAVLIMNLAASSAAAQFPAPSGEAPPRDAAPGAPKPTPPIAAPATRGPTITGVWSGPMRPVSGEAPTNIKLSIGARNLATEYPDFNCTGKLTRIGASKSYVFFVEIITKGQIDKGGRCPDGTITVARQGEELVRELVQKRQGSACRRIRHAETAESVAKPSTFTARAGTRRPHRQLTSI